MVDIVKMFDSSASSVPQNLPKGGTTYLYVWNEESKKKDWCVDGYRWRQNGNGKQKIGDVQLYK